MWTVGIDDAIGALSIDASGKDGGRVNLKAATLSYSLDALYYDNVSTHGGGRVSLKAVTLSILAELLSLLGYSRYLLTYSAYSAYSTVGGVRRIRGARAGPCQGGQPQPQDEPVQGACLEELAKVAREPDEHRAVTRPRPRRRRRGREGARGLKPVY